MRATTIGVGLSAVGISTWRFVSSASHRQDKASIETLCYGAKLLSYHIYQTPLLPPKPPLPLPPLLTLGGLLPPSPSKGRQIGGVHRVVHILHNPLPPSPSLLSLASLMLSLS
mmetsp:Transcript_15676/g.39815  ORF Transcript_15676/g.39815 Transcript_15676/m.39815 type:complete len:113 (-) Transcript_15676:2080-2418(-)